MKQCPNCHSQNDDSKIYCSNCGNILGSAVQPPVPTEKKTSNAGTIFISIILCVSFILNVILGVGLYNSKEEADDYSSRYRSMLSDYNSMQSDYYSIRSDYNEIKDSYDFYYDYARVVPDDGSGKYHRYGCSNLDISSFWIYNVDFAKDEASPCPYCCPND